MQQKLESRSTQPVVEVPVISLAPAPAPVLALKAQVCFIPLGEAELEISIMGLEMLRKPTSTMTWKG